MAAAAIARRRGWMALVTTRNQVRTFLVDTLGVARRMEAQGVPPNQAEAITSAITKVLNDSLENVSQSVVTNGRMQMSEIAQDNLSKFKSEVLSSQEHYFSLLQRETEELKVGIEKMRSELRHEINNMAAQDCLDLNLKRRQLREEVGKQSSMTSDFTNKLDQEILSLKAQLKAGKYNVINYCIGSFASIFAVGVVALKFSM